MHNSHYFKAAINKNSVTGSADTSSEEKYVIGVAISNDEIRQDLFDELKKPSMFTTDRNREIWAALLEMNSIGAPIEEITVLRNLVKSKTWQGDLETYKQYMERGSASVALDHAKYIYANYCVRRVKVSAKKIYSFESISVDDVQDFLINQIQLVDELGKLLPSKDKDTFSLIENAETMIYNPKGVIPFPIDKLNRASGGMTRGHISVIGGRTGHGKTTFICNCVDGWLKQGYKVRWYSREQSAEEMMQACIILNSDIDRSSVRKRKLSESDKKKIKEAMIKMKKPYENLVIKDDIDNMEDTIGDIVSAKEKPDIIVDDFIQLINVQGVKSGKRYEIEEVLKKYHWLQKRYGFTTLMASQLSRAVETRQFDNEPRLSDLAEASFIEQLSENVLLLWWEYKFLTSSSTLGENEIKMIFGKTRFGKTGHIILNVDPKSGIMK